VKPPPPTDEARRFHLWRRHHNRHLLVDVIREVKPSDVVAYSVEDIDDLSRAIQATASPRSTEPVHRRALEIVTAMNTRLDELRGAA